MSLTRRKFLQTTAISAVLLPFARSVKAGAVKPVAPDTLLSAGLRIHSVCGLCQAKCLIDGVVKDGRLVNIDGNPKDPATSGKICARGKAALHMLDDPDRLKYPLKRAGLRGEGKWARISWSEAIDTVASQMEKALRNHGPQALALFYNGSSSAFIRELFAELGCRHLHNPSDEMCSTNQELAYGVTATSPAAITAGLDKSECIVLIGSHLGENVQVPVLKKFAKAMDKGANLIVVDPRLSAVAAKSDYHLMVRPGTDTMLLLGWLKYIVDNGLYGQDYVNDNIDDVALLKESLSKHSLREIAAICDISLSDLKRTAELIAVSAPNVSLYPGQRSNWYGNDVQRLRAQAILASLLGGEKSDYQPVFPDKSTSSSAILRKMLSGDIKLIGCWGQNPFQAFPNPYRTTAAFNRADFTFCTDIYPGEAALHADIVLPEASFLERSDILEHSVVDGDSIFSLRKTLVAPRFEAKDPYWIVKQFSSRLGKGQRFGYDDIEARLREDAADLGVNWHDLIRDGFVTVANSVKPLQNTPQLPAAESFDTVIDQERGDKDGAPAIIDKAGSQPKKHRLFSIILQERGNRPLPIFEPTALPPSGYVRLLTGRTPVHSGSTTINNRWLNHEIPVHELWLNDKVAGELGINNGDQLFLENQDGVKSIRAVRIKVTPGIRVDCVYMAHGFGCRSPFLRNAFSRGVSDASLMTRSVPDPVSGGRGISVNFVRFVKDGKVLPVPQLDRPPEILLKTKQWWLDSFGCFEKGSKRKNYV